MIRAVIRRLIPEPLRQVWHMKYCPVYVPWFHKTGRIAVLKRVELQQAREFRRERGEWFRLLMDPMLWPLVSCARAVTYAFGVFGSCAKHDHGIGRLRQILHQTWLANRYNVSGFNYYTYRLWSFMTDELAAPFGFSPLLSALHEVLNDDADVELLNNKVRFHQHCRSAGLRTAKLLAVFRRDGVREWVDGESRFPHTDLFLKPADACAGEGAEMWRWMDGAWHRSGHTLDEKGLVLRCWELAKTSDYLVQKRIRNASEMSGWTNGAVPAVRVITCRTEADGVQLLSCELRIPVGKSDVSNASTGGLIAAVSPTGTMGRAIAWEVSGGSFTHHPDTGAAIAGASLPRHDEVVDLCICAHIALPKFFSIAWDVAIAPDGPLLIEGNISWLPGHYIATGRSLGDSRFVDWAHERLVSLGHVETEVKNGKSRSKVAPIRRQVMIRE